MQHRRVLLDGYNLALGQGTGIATYARGLSLALHDLGHEVSVLYGFDRLPLGPKAAACAFLAAEPASLQQVSSLSQQIGDLAAIQRPAKARRLPILPAAGAAPHLAGVAFDHVLNAPRLFKRARNHFTRFGGLYRVRTPAPVEIAHWTYPAPLTAAGAANLYTLHDLVPLRLPDSTTGSQAAFLALARHIAATADHIVTVSETSRRDVIDLLGVGEDRVTNTYQPVEIPPALLSRPEAEVRAELAAAFGVEPGGYLLFFGALEPKKNVGRLIEAYLESGVRTPLLIVGKLGWSYDEALRLLEAAEAQADAGAPVGRVRRIDYQPRSMLVSLIRGAKAVLFPSLYEGFGLPMVEAFRLGAPVLASTGGSLPEVAGDAALLPDPYDVRDLAAAIARLDADPDLRGRLAARGLVRAQLFSREAHAARLSGLYDRVLTRAGCGSPPGADPAPGGGDPPTGRG